LQNVDKHPQTTNWRGDW